ncbi:Transcriptional regulator, DeoR family [Pararobbsia alpina]|uniref:DeoR/GlpR family DNA-binding transcription regulator n=1 Tax=Pararobbsia alpina TaxID=621374 RepID=UPI0039A5356F
MQANKSSLRRRLQIVELVRKRGEVSVDELAQAFDVSSVTIRTDLNYLEQQSYLVRAFGKARYLPQRTGDGVLTAPAEGPTRKASEMAIAGLAADWVGDHQSVMLGAGEITHKILPLLANRDNLALLLNDIAMVQTAQRFVRCELQLTGGLIEPDATVMTGPDAERSVSARSFELCILQASGIDADGNLLCASPALARVFQAGIRAATHTLVVAWHAHATPDDGHVFGSIDELDGVIVDDGLDPAAREVFLKRHLALHHKEDGILEFRKATTPSEQRA